VPSVEPPSPEADPLGDELREDGVQSACCVQLLSGAPQLIETESGGGVACREAATASMNPASVLGAK
jgi:hypothetical protein